ncbi:MAG: hypothetical protein FGM45_01500 [Actinobacteria bacterium]|nr:hypothetical protein [Actinomycetota bacterium]
MLAIDVLKWPGVNQAFVFSFVFTTALALVVIPYGKRRKPGAPVSWGEAMIGSTFIFAVLFLAFGVVPHQWIDHADKNLGWRKDKPLLGPGGILRAKSSGGSFPFEVSYEALRDIIVVVIHAVYIGLFMYLAVWWQKRGQVQAKEIETSTYGRPLVRKT